MPGVSAGNLTVSVMHTISTLAAIASVGVYAKLPLATMFGRKGKIKNSQVEGVVSLSIPSKQAWHSDGDDSDSSVQTQVESRPDQAAILSPARRARPLSERSLQIKKALEG